MLENCVMVVTGEEATEACRTEQLCGVPEASIEGGIQAVRLMWKQNSQEEDWGSSSLTRAMNLMLRNAQLCCEKCARSGPVMRGLH